MGRQILAQPSKGNGKGKVGGESVCGPQFLIVTYEPALFCVWVVVFHVSVMTLLAVSHLCDMNYVFFVICVCVCGCGVRVCVVVHVCLVQSANDNKGPRSTQPFYVTLLIVSTGEDFLSC